MGDATWRSLADLPATARQKNRMEARCRAQCWLWLRLLIYILQIQHGQPGKGALLGQALYRDDKGKFSIALHAASIPLAFA
jgi:hypothetical protein